MASPITWPKGCKLTHDTHRSLHWSQRKPCVRNSRSGHKMAQTWRQRLPTRCCGLLPSEAALSEAVSAAMQHGGAIVAGLHGRPVFQLNLSRSVVPLLLPEEHQIPFAVALEILTDRRAGDLADDGLLQDFETAAAMHTLSSDEAGWIPDVWSGMTGRHGFKPHSDQPSSQWTLDVTSAGISTDQPNPSSVLYELCYILSGQGTLIHQNGLEEPLDPGDSILMRAGAAHCQLSQLGPDIGPSHISAVTQHAEQGTAGARQLAILKFIIPSDNLTAPLAGSIISAVNSNANSTAKQAMLKQQLFAPCLPPSTAHKLLSQDVVHRILQGSSRQETTGLAQGSHTARANAALDLAENETRRSNSCSNDNSYRDGNSSNDNGSNHSASRGNGHRHSGSMHSTSSSYSNGNSHNGSAHSGEGSSGKAGKQHSASDQLLCPSFVKKRHLMDLQAFQLPNQTNRLALAFDPAEEGLEVSFGLEVFDPGHHTPPHVHLVAHEVFFVLAGTGTAFCNDTRFNMKAGDCVVMPPTTVHGIDNVSSERLYCLQVMMPNEMFVEFVHSGRAVGGLEDEDLCNLISMHCGSTVQLR